MKSATLAAQALLAFLLLPGTVAVAVPLLVIAPRPLPPFADAGALPLATGIVLLLWCVREFYAAGRGTLAPWSPPQRLVVSGPYRFSRNPMYVAVVLILGGWAAGFGTTALWLYAVAVAVAFHLRVRLNEEPFLARTQTAAWTRYRAQVPRWIGVRHADHPGA